MKIRLRISRVLLFICLLLAISRLSVAYAQDVSWRFHAAEEFAGGSGTEADPYLIENGEQLAYLSLRVESAPPHEYYALTSDIDLSQYEWVPIGGTSDSPFKGNFDGRGYKVNGMHITGSRELAGESGESNFTSAFYIGLFGVLEGRVSDLAVDGIIESFSMDHVTKYIGGVAGKNMGVISNCSANVSIKAAFMEREYGHRPDHYAATGYIGGLVGENGDPSGSAAEITKSYTTGSIQASGYGGACGGFVGSNWSQITNCYAAQRVTGYIMPTGGFVGSMRPEYSGKPALIKSSYFGGYVENLLPIDANNGYCGAFAGEFEPSETTLIQDCYYNRDANSGLPACGKLYIEAEGVETFGVAGLPSGEMTGIAAAELKGFDFETVWIAETNDEKQTYYPQLGVFAKGNDRQRSDSLASVAGNMTYTGGGLQMDGSLRFGDGAQWFNEYVGIYSGGNIYVQVPYYMETEDHLVVAPTEAQARLILQGLANRSIIMEKPDIGVGIHRGRNDIANSLEISSISLVLDPDWLQYIDAPIYLALAGQAIEKQTLLGRTDVKAVTIPCKFFENLSLLSPQDKLVLTLTEVGDLGLKFSISQNGQELDWHSYKDSIKAYIRTTGKHVEALTNLTAFQEADGERILIPWSWSELKYITDIETIASSEGYTSMTAYARARIYSPGELSFNAVPVINYMDTSGHWGEPAICFLSGRNILEGVGNGLFEPEGELTNAQIITIFMRTAGIGEVETGGMVFADAGMIPEWAAKHVTNALNLGIIQMDDSGKFNPSTVCTRESVFVTMYRMLDILGCLPEQYSEQRIEFSDWENVSSGAREPLRVLFSLRYIQGYEGEMRPQETLTRAEAAQLIYNFIAISTE